MLNIFQLWKENFEKTQFAVRRWNWGEEYYTVVVKVEIKRWPYGIAYGYPTINGVYSDHYEKIYPEWNAIRQIPNAGSYQWEIVEDVNLELFKESFSKEEFEKDLWIPSVKKKKKKLKQILNLDSKITFGKHKGDKVIDIINVDYPYIIWCLENIYDFCFSNDAIDIIINENLFPISEELIKINKNKETKIEVFNNDNSQN